MINKSNITRKDYKMLCLIVKNFWFKKQLDFLLDIVSKIKYLEIRKLEVWDLYKDYVIASALERNQFAVLTHICKADDIKNITNEIKMIANRYKRSSSTKKIQFLDD